MQKKQGRRAFYQKPEEMQIKIDEYFKSCEWEPLLDSSGKPIFDKNGRQVYKSRRVPSLSGLAHYLGFADRRTFIRYKRKPEFVDTVLFARLRVEEALEDLRQGKLILVTDDPDRENEGDFICALVSNFGWAYKPKQHTEAAAVRFIDRSRHKSTEAPHDPAPEPIPEERKSAPVSC